jgi:hypothetical protein
MHLQQILSAITEMVVNVRITPKAAAERTSFATIQTCQPIGSSLTFAKFPHLIPCRLARAGLLQP